MAKDHDVELAVSNPCFELWLVLHFRESPGARTRHHVQRMLRSFLPGHAKRVDFAQVEAGVEEATVRARRLDGDARSMGEAGRNPTTGMHRLVTSMQRR